MAPRRRCPVCRSKQWHKEPSSGLIACSEGHVLQNYRNEATETEEAGPHVMRKRALKSGRTKKGKQSNADPKLYHGARGRYHFFLCQQLLLRKQIAVLRQLWALPPEFEIICRDLWALHLSLLDDPPPAEPYFHIQELREGKGGDDSSGSGNSKGRQKAPTPDSDAPADPNDDSEPKEESSSLSSSSSSSSESEDDELATLLRENSEISSSSDEGGEEKGAPSVPVVKSRGQRPGRNKDDGMDNTVAVLMLGCWTMRVPVLYVDFAKIIESYELPYLDPVRLLPQSMVVHLTKHDVRALSPAHAPSTLSLHGLTSRLAKRLYSTYGVFTPEANAAPILWRVTQYLGGTPTLYSLTKRLSHVLSLPLTLHHSLAPGLRRVKRRDPESHKYDNVPPELGLLAAGIVVLKMVYGLDGRLRVPNKEDDPACALPRIDEYLKFVRELEAADSKRKEGVFNSERQMNVGDLCEDMVDEYLDFCERALLGSEEGDGDKVLASYFPMERDGEKDGKGVRGAVDEERGEVGVTKPKEDDGDERPLRPGEAYAIYNSRDVFGSVPEEYEVVLGRGARSVGVPAEYVGGVVEKYERRIVRWWKGRSREGKGSGQGN